MEVRDGFIVGIFNYCDRWCETCAFTSRCRLFADSAEIEAKCDPGLKEVADAPPLPEDVPPPPPRWMQELIDEMNKAASEPPGPDDYRPPPIPPEHEIIESRADEYFTRVHAWLRARPDSTNDPRDPSAVVAWFHMQILVKIHRAIRGLAENWPDEPDWPADHDGSAKVALLGIDRSHAAWLELVERGLASQTEIAPFVADLIWLGDALEHVFPRARSFVRPGLDEPDEVAMLIAKEGC